jgi:polysulfide reductase-like protein
VSVEGATVARTEPTSYYGRPVLKPPVWSPEIPVYFFTGGLAGASAGLALAAGLRGNDVLARRAWLNAAAGIGVSPALLVSDLGRPGRFLNMLRLFKVTSPMSVGSWVLAGSSLTTTIAAADAWTGVVPAHVARPARGLAAALGLPLATYTAALVANTAVPVWHEARRTLPFVFAAGAATSAGAAALLTTPPEAAAPARRLAVGGAVSGIAATEVMTRRLGPLGAPYGSGAAGRLKRAALALSAAGAGIVAGPGARSRPAAMAGGALLLGGALCERWSVFRAGFQSAADPQATIGPQRRAIAAGERRGASRKK